MNNKVLMLSLFMAAVAIFFVSSYVNSIEEEGRKKYGTEVLVLSARKDIKEMETINETMLQFKTIPKKYLEPSAISLDKNDEEKESAKTLRGITGTIAIVPIKKGEQFTFNKVTDPSIRTGLAPQIAPGRRAISIPISEVTGISKLIKPGDRVDLIAVIDLGGGKANKIAKTVLQDVVVLSIGRNITNNIARTVEQDPASDKPRIKNLAEDFSFTSVNIEVEPAQAQNIALLVNAGDNALTLSLRNNDDSERPQIPSSVLKDLYSTDLRAAPGTPPGRR